MATGTSRLRSTIALVNWVVPIITPVMVSGATADCLSTPSMAATTPAPTSAVVGALMDAATVAPSISNRIRVGSADIDANSHATPSKSCRRILRISPRRGK